HDRDVLGWAEHQVESEIVVDHAHRLTVDGIIYSVDGDRGAGLVVAPGPQELPDEADGVGDVDTVVSGEGPTDEVVVLALAEGPQEELDDPEGPFGVGDVLRHRCLSGQDDPVLGAVDHELVPGEVDGDGLRVGAGGGGAGELQALHVGTPLLSWV